QAEDGIRDFHVTGVQTCALPISEQMPDMQVIFVLHPNPTVRALVKENLRHPNIHMVEPLAYAPFLHLLRGASLIITDSGGIQERSEERRVGKEWRCRWAPEK